MARDANGTYTLPNAVVVTGNTITSSWANTSFADFATEFSDSLSRSGKGSMSAGLRLSDGTVSLPGMTFSSETSTGFYVESSGVIGMAVTGTKIFDMQSNGIELEKRILTNDTTEATTALDGSIQTDGGISTAKSIVAAGDLVLLEKTDHTVVTPIAGSGYLWTKNTTPNELWFTNDAGTDFNISTAAAGTGNAATITIADESTDTTCFPVFSTAATGQLDLNSGTNLTFNSSTGALAATTFNGSGSGLTSLNGSQVTTGTIAAARVATLNQNTTGNSATVTVGTTSSTTCSVGLWESTSGSLAGKSDAGLTYNASTNALLCSGEITAYSDRRLKTDIVPIDDALRKVEQIGGYTFTRVDNANMGRRAGVIAQEVLEVLPEVVTQDAEGNYAVSYGNMVGLLVEAIKELKAEVESLK